ncbi:MAG: MarR family transcriptional regulator [Actinomycetota bacterium]
MQLSDRLDHELHQQHEMALIDYEILSRLAEAPDDRLRMSDLATKALVSRSRLTYRVDRLVDVGYIRREECEDDRRGMWAIVTESGRRAFDAARPDHEGSINAWFFDQFSPDELLSFTTILARVADKLAPSPRTTG